MVNEPLVQLVTTTSSNTSEDHGVDAENPVPETVSVAPTGPCSGATLMAGVVTVNAPVAACPPASVVHDRRP